MQKGDGRKPWTETVVPGEIILPAPVRTLSENISTRVCHHTRFVGVPAFWRIDAKGQVGLFVSVLHALIALSAG